MTLDTTLLAALISAAISFAVVWFHTYFLEPRQKEKEERTFRKQQLRSWIADMASNQRILHNRQRHLEQLAVDGRPLDRLTLRYPQLVDMMVTIRSRILVLNRKIEIYDAAGTSQLKYFVMPNPLIGEPYPPDQAGSGEVDVATHLQNWGQNWVAQIDETRERLLPNVIELKTKLESALAQENGRT